MPLKYEKVADYRIALRNTDPPKIRKHGKSKCAGCIDLPTAQRLLDQGHRDPDGAAAPRRVHARHEGVWYEAKQHGGGGYHGYPVDEHRVPPKMRKRA